MKDEICQTLKSDSEREELIEILGKPELIQKLADNLPDSQLSSIDAYLECNNEEELVDVGKFLIAKVLQKYERERDLMQKWIEKRSGIDRPYLRKIRNNWYQYLVQDMHAPFEELGENITIITFNYDRSLEQFLYRHLKSTFLDKNEQQIAKKIKSIPIIHIHGSLGPLPWCSLAGETKQPVPYRWDSDRWSHCAKISAENIKIVSEQDDLETNRDIQQARKALNSARQLYFLGFAYHEENIHKLGLECLRGESRACGTCHGVREGDIKRVEGYIICGLNRIEDGLRNMKVDEFYEKVISFNY
ncbi:MAG: SIR2 family protein [Planctomycetota bacterium]